MYRLSHLTIAIILLSAFPAWAQRLQSEVPHDTAIPPASMMVITGCEAKDQDGVALPRAVSAEGDAVRCAATLSGVQYFMPVNEDGSAEATINAEITRAPAAGTVNAENAGMVADATMVAAVANTRLLSATFQENAGTPANAFGILRHGVSTPPCSGNVIMYVKLGPSQSVSMSWGSRGLAVASGVCMDWISGTIDGSTSTVVEAAP